MKLVRAKREDEIFYGVLEGDRIDRIEGDLFGDWHRTGDWIGRPEVQLLAPVAPINIFAIGLNYRKHASESEMDLPERPLIFLKADDRRNPRWRRHPAAEACARRGRL